MNDPALCSSDIESNGQTLCMACGLCCRGVWFSHVDVDADEMATAQDAGLTVTIDEKGQAQFQQPCVLYHNNRCSAYGKWRPKTCVEYQCALLKKSGDGTISFASALAYAKAARALADQVGPEIMSTKGGLRGAEFAKRLARQPNDSGQTTHSELSPATKLDAVALLMYYGKYFKNEDVQTNPDESAAT